MTSTEAPPRLQLSAFGVTTASGWQSERVSAELHSGECLALLGRPGSGKTLLLEQLGSIYRPGVKSSGASQVRPLALVPQDARLTVLPTDRVWSLVGLNGFGVRLKQMTGRRFSHSVDENRTITLLEELRLDADRIAELPFRDLSSSERRCVLLAAALLSRPEILAIDGWDEQMDGPSRERIAQVLHKKMKNGLSVLLTARKYPLKNFTDAQVCSLGETAAAGDGPVPLIQKITPSKPHDHALLELNRVGVEKRRLSLLRRRPPAFPVDGASLFVRHGETVALLGPAGAGKTTLLRAISGLHPANRGTIRVEGNDVTLAKGRRARRLRRDVQLVFQDAAAVLDGHRTVQSHLEEAMMLKKGLPGSPSEWLERLGLSPRLLKAPADQLSAAEAQRVDLARSLVVAPKLVLFDAPEVSAAGADGGTLAALLQAEKAQGRAFLIATSDPELAHGLADRIAIFLAGRVVEFGSKEQVLEHPTHPLTQAWLRSGPVPPADPTAPSIGCPYIAECPRRQLPQCDEQEPMLAPLQSLEDLSSDQESGTSRRVACFHPIVD